MLTFDSWSRGRKQFKEFKPAEWIKHEKFAEVRIQSRFSDWYINDELTVAQEIVSRLAKRFENTSCIGFSMGGFAALLFGSYIRSSHVLAISPQFCPGDHESPVRDIDKSIYTDQLPTLMHLIPYENRSIKGTILFDSNNQKDTDHATSIGFYFPNVVLTSLPGGGHPASKLITADRQFNLITRVAIAQEGAISHLGEAHNRLYRSDSSSAAKHP
jgi:hypothetical protein